mgnify:CR=1 FL=1
MDENLYFDTRNKKGQKYSNFLRYKKEKSIKYLIDFKKIISKEKKNIYNDKRIELLQNCSWYRCRHHHHCDMCHQTKKKVNKIGIPKTIFRIKEYKNVNFDFVVNKK